MEFQAYSGDQVAVPPSTPEALLQAKGNIKWVTLGDASIKFFHANAAIKYRRNLITILEDVDGSSIVEHHAKANLI